jgi:hypothetical protein
MALTNVYGVNYANTVAVPAVKVNNGEYGGQEHVIRESFTLDADAGGTETVYMGKLPAGAMVISARLFGADLGGSATFELGNAASADAVEAVDIDGFIDAGDPSGAAYDILDSAASTRGASIGIRRFASPVDIILTFGAATSGATGKIVYMVLKYIIV